jgi:hypothetical protein
LIFNVAPYKLKINITGGFTMSEISKENNYQDPQDYRQEMEFKQIEEGKYPSSNKSSTTENNYEESTDPRREIIDFTKPVTLELQVFYQLLL